MAISDFTMTDTMVADLAKHCDMVVLRYDEARGSEDVLTQSLDALRHTQHRTIHRNGAWNRWNWREQLVRELDTVCPDYVLFPDHDEQFPASWWQDEFRWFRKSGKARAMFHYEMVTEDDRPVDRYPLASHCKAFRWVPGITYKPYLGYAIPGIPGLDSKDVSQWESQGRVKHFCFYTQGLQRTKNLHK